MHRGLGEYFLGKLGHTKTKPSYTDAHMNQISRLWLSLKIENHELKRVLKKSFVSESI